MRLPKNTEETMEEEETSMRALKYRHARVAATLAARDARVLLLENCYLKKHFLVARPFIFSFHCPG